MCWICHLVLTIIGVQGFRVRTTTSQRLAATVLATLVSGCVAVGAGGAARSAEAGDDGGAGARAGVAFRLGAQDRSHTALHLRGRLDGRTVPDASGDDGHVMSGRG